MNGCGFHKLLLLSECFDATSLCQSDGRCSLLMGSKAANDPRAQTLH